MEQGNSSDDNRNASVGQNDDDNFDQKQAVEDFYGILQNEQEAFNSTQVINTLNQ